MVPQLLRGKLTGIALKTIEPLLRALSWLADLMICKMTSRNWPSLLSRRVRQSASAVGIFETDSSFVRPSSLALTRIVRIPDAVGGGVLPAFAKKGRDTSLSNHSASHAAQVNGES